MLVLGQKKVQYRRMFKDIYKNRHTLQRFRHRYVFNKKYLKKLCSKGMKTEGRTRDHLIAAIRVGKNVVGVQYHPELKPRPDDLFAWFLKNK